MNHTLEWADSRPNIPKLFPNLFLYVNFSPFCWSGDQGTVASWFYPKKSFHNNTFRAVNHIIWLEWADSRPNISVILRPLFVCEFILLLFRRSRNWSLKRWEALSSSTAAPSQTYSGNMSGMVLRTIWSAWIFGNLDPDPHQSEKQDPDPL